MEYMEYVKGSCNVCGNVKELAAFCQSQLIEEPGNWVCKACTGDSTGVSVDYQYTRMTLHAA